MRGLYVVVESIDGGGKGTIVRGFREHHERLGETVFGLNDEGWSASVNDSILTEIYGTTDRIPRYHVLKEALAEKGVFPAAYVVCEPTFGEMGRYIREVLIHNNHKDRFSAATRVQAYAEDRHTLLERLILPALEDGVHVYSERNVVSSLAYQATELDCDFREIAKVHGNAFALRHLPQHTIIAAMDVNKALRNLASREKDDECFFEEPDFQHRVHEKYMDPALHEFLEFHGTNVTTLEIPSEESPEETVSKATGLLEDFLAARKRNVF